MNECIVFVHGMLRTGRDMSYMAWELGGTGYATLLPTLPTTFGTLETCTRRLENYLQGKLDGFDKVHFVGHSMGGLVTRNYLARNILPNLGKCVLLGVPNRGVFWVKMLARNPLFGSLVGVLPALLPPGAAIGAPANKPVPSFGLIGGTVNRGIVFGFLFGKKSDGRVPVSSLPLGGADETLWLPLNHHKIHRSPEGVAAVRKFLTEGHF